MRPFVRLAALLSSAALIVGCQAQAPADKAEEEAPAASTGRLVLSAPAPAAADELAESLAIHMDDMTTLAKPFAPDLCEEMGPDLVAYLDLVKADFVAARKLELAPEAKARLSTSYSALAEVSGRCNSVPEGRKFNETLFGYLGGLKLGS